MHFLSVWAQELGRQCFQELWKHLTGSGTAGCWLWECPSPGCCLSLSPCRHENRDCLVLLWAGVTRVMKKQKMINLEACWGWESPELCASAVGQARWWHWEVPAEAEKGHGSRDGGDLERLSRGTEEADWGCSSGNGKGCQGVMDVSRKGHSS